MGVLLNECLVMSVLLMSVYRECLVVDVWLWVFCYSMRISASGMHFCILFRYLGTLNTNACFTFLCALSNRFGCDRQWWSKWFTERSPHRQRTACGAGVGGTAAQPCPAVAPAKGTRSMLFALIADTFVFAGTFVSLVDVYY